jgi:hypothetical protein
VAISHDFVKSCKGLTDKSLYSQLCDHTELFKQFSDNPSFKRWLTDMVFDSTYHPGAVPPKAPPRSGATA